jgi:hypothetical protein
MFREVSEVSPESENKDETRDPEDIEDVPGNPLIKYKQANGGQGNK